jgi:hypothetical protein
MGMPISAFMPGGRATRWSLILGAPGITARGAPKLPRPYQQSDNRTSTISAFTCPTWEGVRQ